ncbi:hypothetical protein R3P38DRAFT_1849844 [Favolaschia claudopus]|uniref:Uncharacterized protein n=1 Tax=Favolaschia claudopus TaxID=2862362 RepID=A0AAW0D8F4_9AGAR
MCSFTSLRTLKLLDCQNLSTSDCLDCLRSASLLEDLSLAYLDKRMGASLASQSLPIVLHTSLKTLRLKPDKQIPCPPRILRYLTLPALQYLSLFQISQDGGLMSEFFTRSSPPLDYLEIGYLHPQSAPELGYLSLLPSLTQLILQYHQAASSIFRKLAVDAGLLPNLQRLIVISATNLHVYAELVELLAACKGRHGVLLSIYASFAYGEVEPVPPNFLTEFQRGTEGGSLHLHVGPSFEVNEVECLCSNSYLHDFFGHCISPMSGLGHCFFACISYITGMDSPVSCILVSD